MDIREADDEDLINALKDRGILLIDAQPIRHFSDTELNNELSRRRQIHEKQYEEMMAQGLV